MAKYRATVMNERSSEVSKNGNSMLEAHVRSWDTGVRVHCVHDEIRIYKTGGSNSPSNEDLITILEV